MIFEGEDGFGDSGQAPKGEGGALETGDIERGGDAVDGQALEPVDQDDFGPGSGLVEALQLGLAGESFGGKIGHGESAAGRTDGFLGTQGVGDGGSLVGGCGHGG